MKFLSLLAAVLLSQSFSAQACPIVLSFPSFSRVTVRVTVKEAQLSSAALGSNSQSFLMNETDRYSNQHVLSFQEGYFAKVQDDRVSVDIATLGGKGSSVKIEAWATSLTNQGEELNWDYSACDTTLGQDGSRHTLIRVLPGIPNKK